MVAGGTGSTSVSYAISAVSKGNCYTAASPVVTVANSNDAMGSKTLAVTSQAIAVGSNVVTVTVGSTTGLASGFWGLIDGTSDNSEFGGYHHFTVASGTTLTYLSTLDSRYFMSSTTATGGNLHYYVGNHLTFPTLPAGTNMWQWIVWRCIGASCALPANAANFSLVYAGYPANLGYTDATYNTWDDFGTTMTQTLAPGSSVPWFIPTNPPATNVNDSLTTQITGISGSTLTLLDNAGNSATTSPVAFGNDYALNACHAATPKTTTGGGGSCHFPPPVENAGTDAFCYVTSGYITFTGFVDNLGGVACPRATWNLGAVSLNGTNEDGARMVAGSFGQQSLLELRCLGANPCLQRAGSAIRNLFIDAFGPGQMLVFQATNGGSPTTTENVHFQTSGSTDYMSILYYSYAGSGGGFGGTFNNTAWTMGPTQVIGATDTPGFISKNNAEWHFNYFGGSLRGFYDECNQPAANACGFYVDMKMGQEWQGPITPLITLNSAVSGNVKGILYFEHFFQDSGGVPMFVQSNTVGSIGAPIFINQSDAPGSSMPIISGDVPNGGIAISTTEPLSARSVGINHDISQCTGQENIGNSQGYTGCGLPALNLATASYGVNHTLTGSEGVVYATAAGITLTLPHALAGQTWDIYNPSVGAITLTVDSGTLSGNGAVGNISVNSNQGVRVSCNGTNCSALGLGGGAGGSSSGLVNALQSAGTGGSFQGTNPPTAAGNYLCGYTQPTSSSVAPTCPLPGIPINQQVGTTYTIGAANYWNDRATMITATNGSAQTYTAVNPSTTGFSFNMPYIIWNRGAGVVTETSSGFKMNGTLGGSINIPPSWVAPHFSDGVDYFIYRVPSYEAFPASCSTAITIVAGVFGCGAAGSVSAVSGDTGLFCNVSSTGAVTLVPCATTLAHKFWGNNAGATGTASFVSIGKADLPATVVFTDQANTYGAFLQDFSAGTWKAPTSAGCTAGATSMLCYDSTNKNMHLYANNADAINAVFASAPTNNIIPKSVVASSNVLEANSSITDDGTTVTTTDTGGVKAPAFTSTGTTAGFVDYPQGTTSAAVAPCNTANSICEQAPASVTAYTLNKPAAAPVNNNSAALCSNASPSVCVFAKMPQTAFLTSNYTNATTTFSNVTNLSFPVEASTNYKVTCDLDYQTSATTADVKIQWTGPASPTAVTYDLATEVTASTLSASVATAFSTALSEAGTPTITTNFPLRTTMTLINGANAGTIQLQAAATGTGTITIIPGSCVAQ